MSHQRHIKSIDKICTKIKKALFRLKDRFWAEPIDHEMSKEEVEFLEERDRLELELMWDLEA